MRGAVGILDRLQSILESAMPVAVNTVRTLHDPTCDLPHIERVYQEEWDYGQLQETPALVLYEGDITLADAAGLVTYSMPIDVIAWDICDAGGMNLLHRRLKWWRYCVVDTMLTNYRSDRPYWDGLTMTGLPSIVPMQEETIGIYGRGLGCRFVLDVTETY